MSDTEQIRAAYTAMYDAMIAKDEAGLSQALDESFVLVHMTGMRQSKHAFIRAVLDGTLNYFSAKHERMDVTVTGDAATLVGHLPHGHVLSAGPAGLLRQEGHGGDDPRGQRAGLL